MTSHMTRRSVLFALAGLAGGLWSLTPALAKKGSDDGGGSGSGDDHGGSEPGDDKGGGGEVEPGDDKGGGGAEPGDDNGGEEPGKGGDETGKGADSGEGGGSERGLDYAIEPTADGIRIRYSDGFVETIGGGVLVLTDPRGKIVVRRNVTARDVNRLRAMGVTFR